MTKIRRGFVSNSSSSSFVVAFPKDFAPSTAAVVDYVFNGKIGSIRYCDLSADILQAARIIAADMKQQQSNDQAKINDAMRGYLNGMPNARDFKKGADFNWDAYNAARKTFVETRLEDFQSNLGDADLYVFNFSDEDGDFFCTLEHGGTFDNVKHICISNH